jgi:uncharacterized damage-inducible protein DinB
MACTMWTRGGRDVARQLVHLHNVRWTWLSMAGPRWLKGVARLNPKAVPTRAQLKSAHTASAEAVGRWIAAAIDKSVKMKNFAGGPYKALGYFLAHDAHHRGNILLTLKFCGHKVDTATQHGIWWLWHKKGVS